MSTLVATTIQSGTIKGADGTNTAMTISNDGTVLHANGAVPTCQMFHNTTQTSIAQTTWTQVLLNSENFDTHTMGDTSNNRINITTATAGIYHCFGQLRIYGSGSHARFIAAIRKNGTSAFCQAEANNNESSNNKYTCLNFSSIETFSNGDHISLWYYVDKSGTYGIDGNIGSCMLGCYRISA